MTKQVVLLVCMAAFLGGCMQCGEATGRGAGPLIAYAPELAAKLAATRTLPGLVASDPYYRLGFGPKDDLRQVTIGVGFRVASFGLDALRHCDPTSGIRSLLREKEQMIFPVEMPDPKVPPTSGRTSVKSSITVARRGADRWEAVAYGDADLVRSLHDARSKVMAQGGVGLPSFRYVEVPALHLRMLGFLKTNDLVLIPLMAEKHADLKSYVPLPSVDACRNLQRIAMDYREPPD